MSRNIEDNRQRWPREDLWEPKSDYEKGGKYHKVHATTYRSGHSVEFDDTEDGERIRVTHAKGSYTEMQSDGSVVRRANNNSYYVTVGDERTRTKGDTESLTDGKGILEFKDGLVIKAKYIRFESDTLTHNNKNVGDTHKHSDVMPGSAFTGPPDEGSSAGSSAQFGDSGTDQAIDNLEANVESLNSTVNTLSSNVTSLTSNVSSLSSNVNTLSSNVNSLTSNVTSLSSNVDSLTTTLSTKLAISENLADVANTSEARTNLGLEIGTDVQPYDANTAMLDVEDQVLTGGARVTIKNLGNLSGQSITPDPGDRPMQKVTNNGAGSILPGSNHGQYNLIIVNTTGAGTITTTGWTLKGDSLDTSTTSKFLCSCIVSSDFNVMIVTKVA